MGSKENHLVDAEEVKTDSIQKTWVTEELTAESASASVSAQSLPLSCPAPGGGS